MANERDNKVITSSKLLTEDEALSLANSFIADTSTNASETQRLDKSIDAAWYDVCWNAFRKNNNLKLAVSTVEFAQIVKITDNHNILSCYWSPEKTERKMYMLCPLYYAGPKPEFSVSIATSQSSVVMENGVAYVWPAFANATSIGPVLKNTYFLEAIAIGKKLM